ncbi:casein kinase substrate phosphoprotein PP28-domain-containing protein [Pisolithus orientalis]|uniref:casein kinase substrate phosphoprotein PP28-domain-containing protein n=1 Tax=Pisolithus orientalis TaxID=936130 RepID=UPI0022252AEB|nr:casein kinase substrate phosphoprotein PP28-domain-containing protein [Pisolithus orientalis]KAI6003306.1 casein kinase substrate phosphoprotein PP28-domain-containing protein [Pisolithus orientalis]
MVRGTGKFKGYRRGGGRNFSKHLNADGTTVSTDDWKKRRDLDEHDDDSDEDADEDEDEEASSEEDEEDEDGDGNEQGGSSIQQQELSREERRALKAQEKLKKQQKQDADEEEDPDLINPNHVQRKLNISDIGASQQLTRREREVKEKQEAKDRYWKLHAAGKTAEAKADLTRLQKIREEREAAQAKRKAEAEAKAAEIEAKKKAAAAGKRI